ncbi:MAG: hypothetical protein DMG12_10285 [Acidobacteria bacterium]|nr:MAG: hypothetical protein DMG12_10285 [Acidobacteriota bacterium]
MSRTFLGAAVAAGVLLFVVMAPAWAHHSFASEYDADMPAKIQGTVKKVEWINPHSWITIDVKGPGGTVQTWEIEAGAPTLPDGRKLFMATSNPFEPDSEKKDK